MRAGCKGNFGLWTLDFYCWSVMFRRWTLKTKNPNIQKVLWRLSRSQQSRDLASVNICLAYFATLSLPEVASDFGNICRLWGFEQLIHCKRTKPREVQDIWEFFVKKYQRQCSIYFLFCTSIIELYRADTCNSKPWIFSETHLAQIFPRLECSLAIYIITVSLYIIMST